MVFHLVAFGLQLGAHALPELTHSFHMNVAVDPPDLCAVLTDTSPLREAVSGASTYKFVSFQAVAPFYD